MTVSTGDMIRCRVLRHAWDEFDPVGMRRPPWGFRISLRCLRCTTERHDLIDANGEVSSRRYRYVQGYKYAKGERPSAAEFRLLLLKEQRKEARRARVAARERAS